MRRILFALAAQALAAGVVFAADPPASPPVVAPLAPCVPCPPGTVPGVMPGSPGMAPITPYTPNVPGTPPGSPAPNVNPSDLGGGGFARQSEGGTQVAQSFAPNMFGDVLGSRSLRFSYTATGVAQFARTGTTTIADGSQGAIVSPNAGGTIAFSDSTGQRGTVAISQAAGGTNLDYVQPLLPDGSVDTAYARSAIQYLLDRGSISAEQVAQFNRLTPAQQAQILRNRGQINTTITRTLNGFTLPQVQLLNVTAQQTTAGVQYNLDVRADAQAPFPGGSTLVGRVKMSEGTSPLPRDRFIFAYDHFDNVPLTTFGNTVNRYQFGVEKTFLDGRWSFEARLPFASTVAATSVQGFEGTNTELGNVRLALKRIISQNQLVTFTHGVAVTLPTAADQVALSALDGSELYRFENRQVTVEPFVAALYAPSERLFGQTWASINFDVTGGELKWNPATFGGSGSQRILDVPFLSVDQQFGYWLIRKETGGLRGLAPFVELHWNYAIAQDEILGAVGSRTQSNALAVNPVATHELNLIAGALFQVGDNLNVSVGASAPLLQRPDRTFDAQVGVRANYLFGRTAAARNPVYAVGTY